MKKWTLCLWLYATVDPWWSNEPRLTLPSNNEKIWKGHKRMSKYAKVKHSVDLATSSQTQLLKAVLCNGGPMMCHEGSGNRAEDPHLRFKQNVNPPNINLCNRICRNHLKTSENNGKQHCQNQTTRIHLEHCHKPSNFSNQQPTNLAKHTSYWGHHLRLGIVFVGLKILCQCSGLQPGLLQQLCTWHLWWRKNRAKGPAVCAKLMRSDLKPLWKQSRSSSLIWVQSIHSTALGASLEVTKPLAAIPKSISPRPNFTPPCEVAESMHSGSHQIPSQTSSQRVWWQLPSWCPPVGNLPPLRKNLLPSPTKLPCKHRNTKDNRYTQQRWFRLWSMAQERANILATSRLPSGFCNRKTNSNLPKLLAATNPNAKLLKIWQIMRWLAAALKFSCTWRNPLCNPFLQHIWERVSWPHV